MAAAMLKPAAKTVKIESADNYPQAVKSGDFENLKYKDQWLFVQGFEGKNIIRWAKLQSWTIKPARLNKESESPAQ